MTGQFGNDRQERERIAALEAERDQLRGRFVSLQNRATSMSCSNNDLRMELSTLKAQVAGLREALEYIVERDFYAARIVAREALAASPSTRTTALIRAGEAAVEETRAEQNVATEAEIGDVESYSAALDRKIAANKGRRKACAAVPDAIDD